MSVQELDDQGAVEFSTDDAEDLEALYQELRGVPGIRVEAIPSPIVEGEQSSSVMDFLSVACATGGAITVALQIVKVLVESRGPKLALRVRRGKDRLEVTEGNLDKALPLLKEFLDAS